MLKPPIPANEAGRLAALRKAAILDTPPEQEFDDLTQLASMVLGMPVSLLSLVDADRQWFKAKVGCLASEGPRETAFCAHAILGRDVLVVPDASRDQRFADNPMVVGQPHVRFYAGAPLIDEDGYALGTLCVVDLVPRQLSPVQIEALQALARQAMSQIQLRRSIVRMMQASVEQDIVRSVLSNTHARLQRQNEALVDLAERGIAVGTNLMAAAGAVVTSAAATLDVARASIWLYDADRTLIRCLDLYELASARHTDGMELRREQFPRYFAAMEIDRTIVADDARNDSRTCEFTDCYLKPLDITAMLDTPIRISGRTVGVLCLEHVGSPRQWTVDEASFAASMTNFFAVSYEAVDRRRSEERYRLVNLATNDAIWDWNILTNGLFWSDGVQRTFGYLKEQVGPGVEFWSRNIHPDDRERVMTGLHAAIDVGGDYWSDEYQFRRGDGTYAVVYDRGHVSRDETGKAVRMIGAMQDITARRRSENELREAGKRMAHQALHDDLTGLPNRALFHYRVGRCLQHTKRDSSYHFAVLFLDLDRFKVVNDSLGHAVGDKLLVTVAERLSSCLRTTDNMAVPVDGNDAEDQPVVARLGGDEFTVLLEGMREPGDAARVAERILAHVCRPVQFDGHEVTTTVSIGIVVGGPEYTSEKDVLRDADAAMYKAKESGKNRYAIFDETLHAAAVARLKLENDLRRATERDELLLHYQPIMSLQSGQLFGFEALVRWLRDGKLVSPADFIPVAEDTGLIVPIGAWVLRQACHQLARWNRQFSDFPNLSMSINLSRRQLGDPGLAPLIADTLRETRLNPASVKLEITESVIMDDPESAREVLSAIKSTGVKLSMDDFGTGYSSLSCLHRFPLDQLKIDRSFIANLEGRRDAAAVVNAVVGLAHNLGLSVVAEGLEKPEQAAFLQAVDCDFGQGYLFSKPLTAESAELFIQACRPAIAA